MELAHQDWKPVVLTKAPPKKSEIKQAVLGKGVLNGTVAVATKNVGAEIGAKNRKLDSKTEAFPITTVGQEFGKKMQAARVTKKLTRKQLAMKLNMPDSEVAKFESGTAQKNSATIVKFRRLLGHFDK